MHNHERDPLNILNFPYRCEMQAKVGRKKTGAGLSTVNEARFEFRIESTGGAEVTGLNFKEEASPKDRPYE